MAYSRKIIGKNRSLRKRSRKGGTGSRPIVLQSMKPHYAMKSLHPMGTTLDTSRGQYTTPGGSELVMTDISQLLSNVSNKKILETITNKIAEISKKLTDIESGEADTNCIFITNMASGLRALMGKDEEGVVISDERIVNGSEIRARINDIFSLTTQSIEQILNKVLLLVFNNWEKAPIDLSISDKLRLCDTLVLPAIDYFLYLKNINKCLLLSEDHRMGSTISAAANPTHNIKWLDSYKKIINPNSYEWGSSGIKINTGKIDFKKKYKKMQDLLDTDDGVFIGALNDLLIELDNNSIILITGSNNYIEVDKDKKRKFTKLFIDKINRITKVLADSDIVLNISGDGNQLILEKNSKEIIIKTLDQVEEAYYEYKQAVNVVSSNSSHKDVLNINNNLIVIGCGGETCQCMLNPKNQDKLNVSVEELIYFDNSNMEMINKRMGGSKRFKKKRRRHTKRKSHTKKIKHTKRRR